MIAGAMRGPFGMTLRRCLLASALPALLATLLAGGLHLLLPPRVGVDVVAAAASPWLSLPLFVIAIVCAVTTARFWPPFAARRPGVDGINRLQRGRLRGCGAAMAGALTVQMLLSLGCLSVLSPLLGAPVARPHIELATPTDAHLRPDGKGLRFVTPEGRVFDELHLRPMAGLPSGQIEATRIEVKADGEQLAAPLECIDSRQLLRTTFAPRAITELRLQAIAGSVPLWFPRGSVVLVGTDQHAVATQATLVALVTLLPTFVALALAALLGRVAALPTVLAVIASLLFVQTIGEMGPSAAAVRALLRGQWLPTSGVFPACLPSLAVGFLAMMLAMLAKTGSRR